MRQVKSGIRPRADWGVSPNSTNIRNTPDRCNPVPRGERKRPFNARGWRNAPERSLAPGGYVVCGSRHVTDVPDTYSEAFIWLRRIFSASRFSYSRNRADSFALADPMIVNILSPVSSWGACSDLLAYRQAHGARSTHQMHNNLPWLWRCARPTSCGSH